jgi:HEAT repeat protein
LLSDENPLVRENACWALGHLSACEAISALEDRAKNDENTAVCTQASWALTQINK